MTLQRLSTAAFLLLAGCAGMAGGPSGPKYPDARFRDQGGAILVTGFGEARGKVSSETEARALSRDAAVFDARAAIESWLTALAASAPREAIQRLAFSAQPVDNRWSEPGRAEVVLRLEKARVREALGIRLK